MVQLSVRPAEAGDLDDVLDIAHRRRTQYERYQPRLWRPAADAAARQRDFFLGLLTDEQVNVTVATNGFTVTGFVVGRITEAPPVYDPGGPTCLIDDFTVDTEADWVDTGPALLAELRCWSAMRGAVQMVVVTAHLDETKRRLLGAAGLSLASEWWTGSI